MEVRNHLAYAWNPSRHRANHVVLVAIVDPHVGIRRPDEDCVDSAVSLFQVIEITIDRIAVGDRVVEIPVLDHHLRLNEAGLCPFEGRQIVTEIVIADADEPFGAPVPEISKPIGVIVRRALARTAFPRSSHFQAFRSGDLLPLGIPCRRATRDKCCVLSPNRCDTNEEKRKVICKTGGHISLLVECSTVTVRASQYKTS